MNYLNEWRKLQRIADDYRKKNSKEIDKKLDKLHTDRILKLLPKILKHGNMVWCRNGSVCLDATPCKTLSCKYKSNRADIVNGCSKCKAFQITASANKWEEARHICKPSDVIRNDGLKWEYEGEEND